MSPAFWRGKRMPSLRSLKQASLWLENQYWRGWGLYFVALLAIAVLTTGTPMQDWALTLQTAAKSLGYGDPNTFAVAAAEVEQYGWVTENSRWIFSLWPPGFVLLEAGLLKVFGSNAPMPLLLLVLSAGLFSAVLMEMRRLLAKSFGYWSWLMPLLVFLFAESRIFLFSPMGLLFGEWLAIGTFFWAVLLLMHTTLKTAILAGVMFAISAYIRSQFELFLDSILLASFGLIVVGYFNKSRSLNISQVSRLLLVSMLVAQALMLPWRLYHLQQGHGLRWVSTAAVMIQNGLTSDVTLQERNGSFVILGGGNVACHLAPEHCGETDKRTMVRTYFNIFLEHPVAWVKEKVQLLPTYWFAPPSYLTYPSAKPDLMDVIQDSILLICLFLSVALLWGVRKASATYLWGGVGLGLLMAHSAIVVFAHLEVRYFFFAKIFGVFSVLLLLGLMMDLRRQRLSSSSAN